MTTLTLGAWFLAFLQATANPAQQPQQQTSKASIEGTVVRTGTGDPLVRAQVTLTRLLPPPPPPQPGQPAPPLIPFPQIPSVMTERDGKFIFRNLEAGQYRIRVQRNGFTAQEYGQKTPTTTGTPLTLIDGQQMKDVVFRLTAAGIVTGRVRDTNGEPVPGATVSLLRSIYNFSGQRTLSTVSSATTDDRGEYRAFWVPPGRYIASVSPGSEISSILGVNQGFIVDRTFPLTFYPGTFDSTRASTLEIQPGAELSAIDFILAQPGTFRLRGRLVEAATGKPPTTASVTIGSRQLQPTSTGIVFTGNTSNVTYNNADGSFEVRNVLPGAYWLRASATNNLDQPINPALVNTVRTANDLLNSVLSIRNAAELAIDVQGSDIEGIVLTLTPGISFPLRLSAEGQELASVGGYDRVRLQLRASAVGANNAFQRTSFAADGASTLDGVAVGEYRVSVSMPGPDFYLKEVTLDRTDVLTSPWQITSQTSGTLNVVVSNKGGQVEGDVLDALSQPVRGNLVVLIPDQGRDRIELYKTATTDSNGHFSIRGITPGGYRVFAWEALEPNAYYDRDVLAQYEPQGKPVRIQESGKETVNLKAIPAPKQ